jgi:uncharacterized membrane protein YoaK (UPF0700 family)
MDHWPVKRVMTVIAVALTFASGAMNVASFTRLGSVFTSVMTGNIVLWGLAAARGSLTLASHTAVAIVGYVAGVAAGSRIAVGSGAADATGATGQAREGEDGQGRDRQGGGGQGGGGQGEGRDRRAARGRGGAWPARVTLALLAELVLLGGFAAGWEITGARPGGWVQFFLLALAAAGMGVQSSTVKNMGLTEVSTTYLTGTLTGLVSSVVSPGSAAGDHWRRLGLLLGLVAGASLTGLLVATAPDGVPALPLAALIIAVVLAWRLPGAEPDRGSLARKPAGLGRRARLLALVWLSAVRSRDRRVAWRPGRRLAPGALQELVGDPEAQRRRSEQRRSPGVPGDADNAAQGDAPDSAEYAYAGEGHRVAVLPERDDLHDPVWHVSVPVRVSHRISSCVLRCPAIPCTIKVISL